jgi:hypothetical protein
VLSGIPALDRLGLRKYTRSARLSLPAIIAEFFILSTTPRPRCPSTDEDDIGSA